MAMLGSPGRHTATQIPGRHPGVSDSGCWKGGLGMGVSTKLPGDADAAGTRATV